MAEGRTEDRRRFLKRAGTVAWATPLILTMAGGTARGQAFSCAPPSTQCGVYVAINGSCIIEEVCCNDCLPLVPETGNPCFCT